MEADSLRTHDENSTLTPEQQAKIGPILRAGQAAAEGSPPGIEEDEASAITSVRRFARF
jgi:hypothetical protein